MSHPQPLSVEDLRALCADPEALERPVTDGDSPLTVVDLADPAGWAGLPELPVTTPRVVVGVAASVPPGAPPPPGFDVLLTAAGPGAGAEGGTDAGHPRAWVPVPDLDAAVDVLARSCTDTPAAATALVQLLRLRPRLDLAGALLAESFTYSTLLAGSEHARWLATTERPAHRPADEPLLVGSEDGTLVLTLNRPGVRHAYDSHLRDALVDVLRPLAALPEPPAVLLRSEGPSFCSGGDLSQFGTTEDPVRAHAIRTVRSPGLLLDALGGRATAQVQGACVGAGVELPAFCHRVVAAPDATFRLPEVAMGLVPGAGGTASIPARIGRHRTAHLALTGATLPAGTALQWGLVDAVADAAGGG